VVCTCVVVELRNGLQCKCFYGLLQNWSLVKLLKQVLDLIGSFGERFE
jgi:hypothetical protein